MVGIDHLFRISTLHYEKLSPQSLRSRAEVFIATQDLIRGSPANRVVGEIWHPLSNVQDGDNFLISRIRSPLSHYSGTCAIIATVEPELYKPRLYKELVDIWCRHIVAGCPLEIASPFGIFIIELQL